MVQKVDAKPVGTLAKKSPVVKFKSQQIAKKNGTKRPGIEQDADLRQPKDRDPAILTVTSEWCEAKKKVFQKLWPVVQSLQIDPIDVKGFCVLAAELSDEESAGNLTFRRWLEIKEEAFQQPLPTYEASFTDQFGSESVEDRVEKLFSDHDQNWESVFRFLLNALDPDEVEQDPDMYLWSFRYMAMMISINHPFKFFRVNDYFDLPKRQRDSSFWKEDGFGLELKSENAMAVFYSMTTLILGDPWVYYFNIHLGTETQFKFKEERLNRQLVRAYQDHEDQKLLDQKKIGLEQGNSGPVKKTKTRSLADWSKEVLDENGEVIDSETKVEKKVNSFLPATAATTKEIIEVGAPQPDEDSPNLSYAVVAKGEALRNSLQGQQTSATPDPVITHHGKGDESISELTSSEDPGMIRPYRDPLNLRSPPKTYRTNLVPSKSEGRPFDIDDDIQALTQMNLVGIPGNGRIFDVTLATTWSGDTNGSVGPTNWWIRHIKDTMKEAIGTSPHGLFLMAIDDNDYKDGSKLIRSPEEVEEKITNYRDLCIYMDPYYGNSPYFTTSYTPGEKKLRTRFRFGFNTEADPDRVRNWLHMGFRHQGRATGCFDTPLQFSPIDKIAFLCFWPEDINTNAMLREIHAALEYRYAVGMKYGWVSMPYNGRSRFNDDSPGIQLHHLFAKRSEAAEVDRILRAHLNPLTPISALPFNASVHYVHDWNSAREGVLSVRANGRVKDLITTMVTKATDYQDLTVVLYPPTSIIGLLKRAQTTHYGSLTLLRLLLSITCTPAQAATADETDERKEEEDKDAHETDDEGFQKVKVVRKKSKKTKAQMDQDPAGLTELEEQAGGPKSKAAKAEQARERKRLRDLGNYEKCRLLLAIFPGEMINSQVAVARAKFEALARNVLRDLIPFLAFHLNEPTREALVGVLRVWFPMTLIAKALASRKVWNTKSMQAELPDHSAPSFDQNLAFLENEFGADILDVFDGTLGIELEMAHVRDVDDGATVSHAMETMNRAEEQLRDQKIEIEHQSDQIIQQSRN